MLHDDFLDLISGPIGRVVTSEESPATAHEFFFWTAETEAAQNLDIGHIVAAESEDATAVAVLDDPRRYSDLQSFLDDFYAYDGDPSLEALSERVEILVFRARVLATKHRDERKKSKRPVRTGPVFFATNAAIEFALGTEDFSGHRIPMLLHENGNERDGSPQRTPLYVDEEYLLGPGGGPPQHHRHERALHQDQPRPLHHRQHFQTVERQEGRRPDVQREGRRPPLPGQAGGGRPEGRPRARRALREGRTAGPAARGPGDVRVSGHGDQAFREPQDLRAACVTGWSQESGSCTPRGSARAS